MSTLSVTAEGHKPQRRRHSREFKAQVVAACRQPGASVSRTALDHGLNANMVRRWIREAEQGPAEPRQTPGFLPIPMPSQHTASSSSGSGEHRDETLRIELPTDRGSVVVHWPLSQSDQCLAWLQGLLR